MWNTQHLVISGLNHLQGSLVEASKESENFWTFQQKGLRAVSRIKASRKSCVPAYQQVTPTEHKLPDSLCFWWHLKLSLRVLEQQLSTITENIVYVSIVLINY